MKKNVVLDQDEYITKAMEVVSFDDTLGKIESVVKSNLSGDKIILIKFAYLYTAIDEFEHNIVVDTIEVNTKCTMADKNVMPVVATFPIDS